MRWVLWMGRSRLPEKKRNPLGGPRGKTDQCCWEGGKGKAGLVAMGAVQGKSLKKSLDGTKPAPQNQEKSQGKKEKREKAKNTTTELVESLRADGKRKRGRRGGKTRGRLHKKSGSTTGVMALSNQFKTGRGGHRELKTLGKSPRWEKRKKSGPPFFEGPCHE